MYNNLITKTRKKNLNQEQRVKDARKSTKQWKTFQKYDKLLHKDDNIISQIISITY